MSPSVRVIGVGNALRGDDAAGLEVARRLWDEPGIAVTSHDGEPLALLDLWDGADAVIVVDAVRSGATVGTIHRIDASSTPVPRPGWRPSGHHVGLAEAIELARSLRRLPPVVVVYGVEGGRFSTGAPVSEPVAEALDGLVDVVRADARALRALSTARRT